MKYVAQVRDRKGRLRFQTGPYDTREQAAQAAFKNGPASARTCSTSEAYLAPDGAWRSNGMDTRWHRRDQFSPGSIMFAEES
jgi:hypothetical protein